jgi:hypothetical protein
MNTLSINVPLHTHTKQSTHVHTILQLQAMRQAWRDEEDDDEDEVLPNPFQRKEPFPPSQRDPLVEAPSIPAPSMARRPTIRSKITDIKSQLAEMSAKTDSAGKEQRREKATSESPVRGALEPQKEPSIARRPTVRSKMADIRSHLAEMGAKTSSADKEHRRVDATSESPVRGALEARETRATGRDSPLALAAGRMRSFRNAPADSPLRSLRRPAVENALRSFRESRGPDSPLRSLRGAPPESGTVRQAPGSGSDTSDLFSTDRHGDQGTKPERTRAGGTTRSRKPARSPTQSPVPGVHLEGGAGGKASDDRDQVAGADVVASLPHTNIAIGDAEHPQEARHTVNYTKVSTKTGGIRGQSHQDKSQRASAKLIVEDVSDSDTEAGAAAKSKVLRRASRK